MPIYEYECESCGLRTEVRQNISDPPLETCQKCSGRLKKLIAPPAIIFKGAGWYINDYPSKDRKQGMEKEKGVSEKKTEKSPKAKKEEKVKV